MESTLEPCYSSNAMGSPNDAPIRTQIVEYLKDQGATFRLVTHRSFRQGSDIANEINLPLEQAVKGLILKGKKSGQRIQVNLLAHCKLDMKAIVNIIGERCDFEKPEVVLAEYDLVVGGVPHLGVVQFVYL